MGSASFALPLSMSACPSRSFAYGNVGSRARTQLLLSIASSYRFAYTCTSASVLLTSRDNGSTRLAASNSCNASATLPIGSSVERTKSVWVAVRLGFRSSAVRNDFSAFVQSRFRA